MDCTVAALVAAVEFLLPPLSPTFTYYGCQPRYFVWPETYPNPYQEVEELECEAKVKRARIDRIQEIRELLEACRK